MKTYDLYDNLSQVSYIYLRSYRDSREERYERKN